MRRHHAHAKIIENNAAKHESWHKSRACRTPRAPSPNRSTASGNTERPQRRQSSSAAPHVVLPCRVQRNAQPQRAAQQESVRHQGQLVVEIIRGTQVLRSRATTLPALAGIPDCLPMSVALQSHFQPVRRFLGLESFALPGKRPVHAIRPRLRICFLRQEIPNCSDPCQACLLQKFLRRRQALLRDSANLPLALLRILWS